MNPGGYGWAAKADEYQGLNGRKFEFGCPSGGELGTVYGTQTYTDDSQVCTAAVHDGKLKRETGGQVIIEIRPGQAQYNASEANGVSSASFESYGGSYIIASVAPFAGTDKPQTGGYGWKVNALELRGLNGQRFIFVCPSGGGGGQVYGTGTYTDDSTVCTSAVHAGKITSAKGGTVTIEIKPGQDSYTQTSANGVTSASFGQYEGSFSFAD